MYLILKFLVHFFDEQSFSGQLNELENHNSLPSKLEEVFFYLFLEFLSQKKCIKLQWKIK